MTDLVVPQPLPRPDCTELVRRAKADGLTFDEACSELSKHIGRQTGAYSKSKAARMAAPVWNDPERYDTYVDDVAVHRAYLGDKEVWANLTHYERDKVIDKVTYNWALGRLHTTWPELEPTEGMNAWATAVGERPERIRNLAQKRKARYL